jgi:hypothetical protein
MLKINRSPPSAVNEEWAASIAPVDVSVVDQLRLHVAPILLGAGTPLFDHLVAPLRLDQLDTLDTPGATHLTYRVIR